MTAGPPSPTRHSLLVIDELDEQAQLAEVEDEQGRTFQVPAEWLPDAADGAAYRVTIQRGPESATVTFSPDPRGAQVLRERSKQTLLNFSDALDSAGAAQTTPHPEEQP